MLSGIQISKKGGLIGGRFLEFLLKIVSCVKNRNFKIMMENSVSNDVPEQTYNDDSLFRPMSLANVSGIADPSTDKSKMLHQIWNEHRSPRDTGTPLNEEEDIEGDHTSTPVVKVHSTSIFMYLLNRWSTPLFIIPEFFLHFPNELSYGYLRFEGNGKIP